MVNVGYWVTVAKSKFGMGKRECLGRKLMEEAGELKREIKRARVF